MAQGLQYYDITVLVNKVMALSAQGKYFRYYSGQASGMDATITLKSSTSGVMCLLKPGQSIKLPESVTDWYIGNYANQATITGIVVVGDGEIVDTNVAGSVSVIDGGIARSMAGVAYLGGASLNPTAANYSHIQLWNPVGSGKNVIVEAVSLNVATASYIFLAKDSAMRATAFGQAANKKLDGAAGAALIRYEYNPVIQQVGGNLLVFSLPANGTQILNLKEPVVIVPGSGINVIGATVNVGIGANFEYFEQ